MGPGGRNFARKCWDWAMAMALRAAIVSGERVVMGAIGAGGKRGVRCEKYERGKEGEWGNGGKVMVDLVRSWQIMRLPSHAE